MKAIVEISCYRFLMTVNAAADLMRLLGTAVQVESNHSAAKGEYYFPATRHLTNVEMKVIRDEQFLGPAKAAKPKAIAAKASDDCNGPCVPA